MTSLDTCRQTLTDREADLTAAASAVEQLAEVVATAEAVYDGSQSDTAWEAVEKARSRHARAERDLMLATRARDEARAALDTEQRAVWREERDVCAARASTAAFLREVRPTLDEIVRLNRLKLALVGELYAAAARQRVDLARARELDASLGEHATLALKAKDATTCHQLAGVALAQDHALLGVKFDPAPAWARPAWDDPSIERWREIAAALDGVTAEEQPSTSTTDEQHAEEEQINDAVA